MNEEIKSGNEILTEFFADLEKEKELDSDTVSAVLNLYKEGKLSVTNIANALSDLRQEQAIDKD